MCLPKLIIWPSPPAPPRIRRITKIQIAAITRIGRNEPTIDVKIEPWLGAFAAKSTFFRSSSVCRPSADWSLG